MWLAVLGISYFWFAGVLLKTDLQYFGTEVLTSTGLRTAQAGDEGGRGLHLVDELSADWGVRSHPHGKTVWFTLAIGA